MKKSRYWAAKREGRTETPEWKERFAAYSRRCWHKNKEVYLFSKKMGITAKEARKRLAELDAKKEHKNGHRSTERPKDNNP